MRDSAIEDLYDRAVDWIVRNTTATEFEERREFCRLVAEVFQEDLRDVMQDVYDRRQERDAT